MLSARPPSRPLASDPRAARSRRVVTTAALVAPSPAPACPWPLPEAARDAWATPPAGAEAEATASGRWLNAVTKV